MVLSCLRRQLPVQTLQGSVRANGTGTVPLANDHEDGAVPREHAGYFPVPFQLHQLVKDALSGGGQSLSDVQTAPPQSGPVTDEKVTV